MKNLLAALSLSLVVAASSHAEEGSFPGLKSVMDSETYARTGVQSLSADQRAALDGFIRDYVANKQRDAAAVAATEAVDRAIKDRKVRPPDVIESRIVGDYKGPGPRVLFHLANGQTWKPTDPDPAPHSPISNPSIVIYRDMFGYKMFVEGAGVLRVKRAD